MANQVNISLQYEASVRCKTKDMFNMRSFLDAKDIYIVAYVWCDEVRVELGRVESLLDLEELAGPEYLIETLSETCTDYEYDTLMNVLSSKDYYYNYIDEYVQAIDL